MPLQILVELLPSDFFLQVELDHLGFLLDFVLVGEVGDGREAKAVGEVALVEGISEGWLVHLNLMEDYLIFID